MPAETHQERGTPRFDAGRGAMLLLVLVTALVFVPVTGHDFVNIDDDVYVTENARLRKGLTLASVAWALTTTDACFWHPLTWLSFLADHQLFGEFPGGYLATNLALHLLNTVLLFVALQRLTGRRWPSFFVAALFALHPLHVESVAWVSQRKDVLSALFWMLTLWAYAEYARHPGPWRYAAVGLCFVLGLMAKPMLVTLPFVLLLLDWWPLGRWGGAVPEDRAGPRFPPAPWPRLVMEKLPLMGVSAAFSWVTFVAEKSGGALPSLTAYPLAVRVANAVTAYLGYLGKTLWPADLAVYYPHPGMPSAIHLTAAGAVLTALTLLAFRWGRTRPWLLIGWLWFLGTLVPVIGLVQVGTHAMADRYTYLPAIGLFMAMVWGIQGATYRWRVRPAAVSMAGIGLLCVLAGVTRGQVVTWQNSITLFSHALAVTPDNYPSRNNLGYGLLAAGRVDEAMDQFRRAIILNDQGAEAYNGRAHGRMARGDVRGALADYRRAMEFAPGFAEPVNGAGNALLTLGRAGKALALFRKAVALSPDLAQAHNNLGLALDALGRRTEALAAYEKAVALAPDLAAGRVNMADTLMALGRPEAAVAQLQAVLRRFPDTPQAAYGMARAMERLGRKTDAVRWYLKTLEMDRTFSPAANNLGVLLARAGRPAEAAAYFRLALQHAPGDGSYRANLSRAEAVDEKRTAGEMPRPTQDKRE